MSTNNVAIELSKENIVHNFADITHDDHRMVEKIVHILEGKEGDEYGHTDIHTTPFGEHASRQHVVIQQQVSGCFVKEDWFFILEMHNMTLFSSSPSSTYFKQVFKTCLSAYNDGNKNVFDEYRQILMTIHFRDCWMEYRSSTIQNGVRIVFKRKSTGVALPPFGSYNRLMRYGFKIRAGYWCRDSDVNSGSWENGEHIHMDNALMEIFELELF